MANSFAILLGYIDNILWLCTQLVYGAVFIIESNYRLVAAVFRGCLQLWGLAIQGIYAGGNAVVVAVELLAKMPAMTYHSGAFLLGSASELMYSTLQYTISWCLSNFVLCLQIATATVWNVSASCKRGWTFILDLLGHGCGQFAEQANSLLNDFMEYVTDMIENTGVAVYSAKASILQSVQAFVHAFFEYATIAVNYPISIFTSFFNSFLEFSENTVQAVILFFHSIISSIANCIYDMISLLDYIAMYPFRVFNRVTTVVSDVTSNVSNGYSSVVTFISKNWYAMVALGLCFVLLTVVTVYLNTQQNRNIQNALQEMRQMVTNLMRSRPQGIPGRALLPRVPHPPAQNQGNPPNEGALMGDVVRDQPAVETRHNHRAVHPHEDREPEQGGPSRPRRRHHGAYALRSRPFTPPVAVEGGESVDSVVSKLQHRLGKEQDRQLCVVCQDSLKNTLFLPCRHLCVCLDCADTIVADPAAARRHCPLCRTRIGSIVEVYT